MMLLFLSTERKKKQQQLEKEIRESHATDTEKASMLNIIIRLQALSDEELTEAKRVGLKVGLKIGTRKESIKPAQKQDKSFLQKIVNYFK